MIKYYIPKRPRILFVGINPHFGSFSRGVPFSNNKTFWYLLSRAGVIREDREFLRSDKNLRKVYRNIDKKYNIGFVNIVDRPTRNVADLKKDEEKKGARRLLKIITSRRPNIVCFIGKITFLKFAGKKTAEYGNHGRIGSSILYVMHFPIRGPSSVRVDELRLVDSLSKKS